MTPPITLVAEGRRIVATGELRRWRRRNGLTTGDVARHLGVHWSCVCHWERGDSNPRSPVAARLAELVRLINEEAA